MLQALWDDGPATIRRLTDALYPGGSAAQYATVQKLLDRLEAKGCVRRNRTGSAHTFSAAIDRDELIGRRLRDMAEKLCGGSLTPLLTHLMRTRRLTADERRELRSLIDDLEQKKGRRGRATPRLRGHRLMETLLRIGLSNAVAALLLALLVVTVACIWRRPAVLHALWLLVLVKLVTPPFVWLPEPWAESADVAPARARRRPRMTGRCRRP